jgi:hypothetical protein
MEEMIDWKCEIWLKVIRFLQGGCKSKLKSQTILPDSYDWLLDLISEEIRFNIKLSLRFRNLHPKRFEYLLQENTFLRIDHDRQLCDW